MFFIIFILLLPQLLTRLHPLPLPLPIQCLFALLLMLMFIILIMSNFCYSYLSVVSSTEVIPLKKTGSPSPRSHQLVVALQLEIRAFEPLSLPCQHISWLDLL